VYSAWLFFVQRCGPTTWIFTQHFYIHLFTFYQECFRTNALVQKGTLWSAHLFLFRLLLSSGRAR